MATSDQFVLSPAVASATAAHLVQADVVVIGAGFAGLCAAAAAAEAGAKTVLIEKGAGPAYRGLRVGAVGDRQQKAAGIEVDREAIIAEIMRWGGYKADHDLVSLWVDQSGAAMDWVHDRLDDAKVEAGLVPIADQVKPGPFTYYPITNLALEGGHETLAHVLETAARERGAVFHYETPARNLIQDDTGRVVGVVAETTDGQLVRFEATRGVVLCTGDYGNNPDMVRTYAPQAAKTFDCVYNPPHNTGDGHQMGLAAGAAMDAAPHCALIFDVIVLDFPEPVMVPLTRQPFLNVNARGERYVNEDLPFAYLCNAELNQPGGFKWVIWDSTWREDVERFKSIICKALKPPLHDQDVVDRLFESGVIKTASTIEDLAEQTGLPAGVLNATVERYNSLARSGHDSDFGKRAVCLSTIETAPFHAVRTGPGLLVTLGGLKINTSMEVLREGGEVIPGLYAAGNASGGFFANDYPINVSGVSHGRALTFGRLAGLSAARAVPA